MKETRLRLARRSVAGLRIDSFEHKTMLYPVLNTAAHELGHQLLGDDSHIETYGLMTPGSVKMAPIVVGIPLKVPARRSYFHSTNIIKLREHCEL